MIFNVFLNAFNRIHLDKMLVGNKSTVNDAKFPGCKHFDLTVKNVWDKEGNEIFKVHKVVTKNNTLNAEDIWAEIYEEMIQRILEHYGNVV